MTARDVMAGRGRRVVQWPLALWPLYGVVRFAATLPIIEPDDRWSVAAMVLARTAIGAVISAPVIVLCRRLLANGRSLPAVLGVAAVSSYALAIAWVVADRLLNTAIVTGRLSGLRVEWHGFGVDPDAVLALFVSAVLFTSAWLSETAARERQAALEHALAARDARLQSLTSQLRPHFLVNALAAVRGVIAEDPERARRMVTALSGFLRSTMTAPDVHALDDELLLAEAFLEVERIRFERPLDLRIDADSAARRCALPAFVLQPLVENAAAHGRSGPDGSREIAIAARRAGGRLTVEISNPGALATAASHGAGIGTENVRARIAHAAGAAPRFSLSEQNGRVIALVDVEARDVR